jgi:hypothetical protein
MGHVVSHWQFLIWFWWHEWALIMLTCWKSLSLSQYLRSPWDSNPCPTHQWLYHILRHTVTKIPFTVCMPRKGIERPQWAIYTYIPRIGPHIFLQQIGPIMGIYNLLTDTWMWKLTEAAHFLYWEYLFRIFVSLQCMIVRTRGHCPRVLLHLLYQSGRLWWW